MNRAYRNLVVWLCCAGALAISGCKEPIGKGWDWNRMRVQPKYEPYRGSRFFANGSAMQAPPTGTVSREAGADAAAPLPSGPGAMARGAAQYHIYCAVCHGERGDGQSLVATDMGNPRPPSLISPPVSVLPASVIVTAETNGYLRMPPFAHELSLRDRQAIAAYVKSLQQ